jgi:hypothetical protein
MQVTEVSNRWNELTEDVRCICMEYTNSKGESAQYLIDIKKNVYECIGHDINTLSNLSFEEQVYEEARQEILQKIMFPKKASEDSNWKDPYENIGVGLQKKDDKLYLFGFLESKEQISESTKEDTRRPLTKIKDDIRFNYMQSTQFRKFIVSESRLFSGTKVGDTLFI